MRTRLLLVAFGLAACAGEDPTPPTAATPVALPDKPPTAPENPISPTSPSAPAQNRPGLLLSADTICLRSEGGEPAPDDVRVTTADSTPLTLVAGISYAVGQPGGWLTATFDRDTTPARLWLRASRGTLAEGTYVATVTVGASDPAIPSRTITVHLTVAPTRLARLTVVDRSNFLPTDESPGYGLVTGPGLDCGTMCSILVPVGTSVTLVARPDSTNRFVCWVLDVPPARCGPSDLSLTITVLDSVEIGKWFMLQGYSVGVRIEGADGVVSGADGPWGRIQCGQLDGSPISGGFPASCGVYVRDGRRGTVLTASPLFGSVFVGWDGACSGSSPYCSIGQPGGRFVATARFARDPSVGNVLRVMLRPGSGDVQGRVTGPGIDCRLTAGVVSGDCEEELPVGTVAELLAQPEAGSRFSYWYVPPPLFVRYPCEAGTPAEVCRLTVNSPREVLAGFGP